MPYSPGRGVEHLLEESYERSIVCVGETSASPQELLENFPATLRLIAREVGVFWTSARESTEISKS